MKDNRLHFLFAGGGTGGHLFPAIAVADKIKSMVPDAEILFIGSRSKIEGKIVPAAGYKFKSIWIKGFSRKFKLENFLFPLKLVVSMLQSLVINIMFRPVVAIGSGGYVSGPPIYGAWIMGAKIILLEQNSYPGITTRMLENKAREIFISFEDSKKYFRNKKKLFLTGNPIRNYSSALSKEDALKTFGLSSGKKTILILGGSLGAGTINKAVANSLKNMLQKNIQIIWQTGDVYFKQYKYFSSDKVIVKSFIDNINEAYIASDIVVARAGATTIAELTAFGIPSILIPSPNVAENHQYFNAKSLSEQNAAILLDNKDVDCKLIETINALLFDEKKRLEIAENARLLGKPEATEIIAKRAIRMTVS